jgi:hypothetical protein
LATYNALLRVHVEACSEVNASRVICEQGVGRCVAIVGHFPFVNDVRRVAETCRLLVLHPQPGDLPAERADEILPQADVAALTSTSLINHTFDDLIRMCHPGGFVVMLGPSTPLSPVLLDFGIDVLSGTVVEDAERVLRSVSRGPHFDRSSAEAGCACSL